MEPVDDTFEEDCEECGEETPHTVELYVGETGNGPFSSEPIRRTECAVCGTTTEEVVGRHCR